MSEDILQGKLIVGIDLGTTNSGIAVWNAGRGKVVMIEDTDAHALTPSMVGWDQAKQDWVVGHAARIIGERRPASVAYSVKRFMGRMLTDAIVRSLRPDLTFKLIPGSGSDQFHEILVDFGRDEKGEALRLTAPQISAKILHKLLRDASHTLGVSQETLKYAVITVPAYFNMNQRRATIEAGRKAGLDVIYLLNEPTSAALAYAETVLSEKERRILVYDLGGGTFDVSLLEVKRDEAGYEFYTRVVDGDTRLGGDDIDMNIAHWLAEEISKQYGSTVQFDDYITRERLRRASEQAKIELSMPWKEAVTVELPGLEQGSRSPFDVQIILTRVQLEKCASPVVQRTLDITKRAVIDVAGLTWEQIDEVILVGGQTLMPAIQEQVASLTGLRPRLIDLPQLAVALGAGEYARILSLGQEKFQEHSLTEVLALPLGIRLDDNTFKVLVNANVTIPHTSAPYLVTTTQDNQQEISVEVFQGPRSAERIDQCEQLGSIKMSVEPTPAGVPAFEVVFDVQADGTMTVVVTDTLRKLRKTEDLFVWRNLLPQ